MSVSSGPVGPTASDVGAAHQERILVVDDDASVRLLLARLLKRHGYAVSAAGSVAEAEAQMSGGPFDLALLDKNLPDGSGLELARHVVAAHPGTAIVVMSAYASTASALQAMELEVSDYLEKPFQSLEDVLARIERALVDRGARCPPREASGDVCGARRGR